MTTEELDRGAQAVADNELVSIGDADGSLWASTTTVAGALGCSYSRADVTLSQLHRDARVERHPSGADFWRRARQGGGGAS